MAILNTMIREGFFEVTFERSPEGSKEVSHTVFREKAFRQRSTGRSKVSKATVAGVR